MRKALILTTFVFGLTGCQQSLTSNGTPTKLTDTSSGAPQGAHSPAKFEIRDFQVDVNKTSYATSYKGRGTLVAKDEELKKGVYMVWLEVKQSDSSADDRAVHNIVLRDGIGTISTYTYTLKDDAEKKKVQYQDWKVIGFSKLGEGIISTTQPVANSSQ